MKKLFLIILISFNSVLLVSQNFLVSGTVKDSMSTDNLIYVTVIDKETQENINTNEYGFFSLKIPKGKRTVVFNLTGYITKEIEINISSDTSLNIDLIPLSVELQEVIISGDNHNINDFKIPIAKLNKIPLIAGETDVLKSLFSYTGVSAGTEGSATLSVRGGSSDQNLYLIDGIPVYNVNHLFGFFSIFNSDAIKSVKFTKGGIPAEYYGKSSSVIDVYTKDGDMSNYHKNISVGLMTAKFLIDGPLKKDKASFMISLRRTYLDLLLKPFSKSIFGFKDISLYFYDLNSNIKHRLNDKNTLYTSVYTGFDKFYLKDEDNSSNSTYYYENFLQWGNITVSTRLNSILSQKLALINLIYFSKFNYTNGNSLNEDYVIDNESFKDEYFYNSGSGIREFAFKSKLEFYWNNYNTIKIGITGSQKRFSPSFISEYYSDLHLNQTIERDTQTFKTNAIEVSGFFEDNFKYKFVDANFGFNINSFIVSDSSYFFFEPRLNLQFSINNNLRIQASYTKAHQYLHLLSNSGIGMPTDLWVPTTKKVLPENAKIIDAGINYFVNKFEITVSGFYKTFFNIIEYQQGISLLETKIDWQDKITKGDGYAYGIELSLQNNSTKFNWQINYTFSRSFRQFKDINLGEIFPYKYDRPHNFNFQFEFLLNKEISFYGNWVLMSGHNATFTNEFFVTSNYSEYYIQQFAQYFYTSYNNFRFPLYHRLDLAMNITKYKQNSTRIWSMGIYNFYNRLNPFYFVQSTKPNELEGVSYAPIMPFLSYSLKF